MLTPRYVNGEYLAHVPDWHAVDAPWKAKKIVELLRRHAVAPRTVCDVGCGAGEILAHLQRELPSTARLTGYDISGQAIDLCQPKSNFRLSFRHGDFLTDSRDQYELLLLLDVLEHVPDYLGFLTRLKDRAKRFVFHIPLDLSVHTVAKGSRHLEQMRERYGHLHYFTRETALRTLEDSGYIVEDAVYTWDNEADDWPPRAPGVRGCLRYPLRCAAYALERLAFRIDPHATARFRPAYNLLILARS